MPCIDRLSTNTLYIVKGRFGSMFGPNSGPCSVVRFRTKPTLVQIIPTDHYKEKIQKKITVVDRQTEVYPMDRDMLHF